MASKPQRRRNPLETSRRSDNRVVGNCVVACVMQKVSPLVNIVGPWFDDFFQSASAPSAGYSSRGKDTHYLVPSDIACFLYNDKVYKIICVRQHQTWILFNGDRPIYAFFFNIASRLGDLGRVCFEPVNRITVIYAKGSRQLSITTTQMNDDAAFNTGCIDNFSGLSCCINLFCLGCTNEQANDSKYQNPYLCYRMLSHFAKPPSFEIFMPTNWWFSIIFFESQKNYRLLCSVDRTWRCRNCICAFCARLRLAVFLYCSNISCIPAVLSSPAWTTTRYLNVSMCSFAKSKWSSSSQYIGVGEKKP